MKMNKAVVDARRNKIMQKIQSQGRAAVEDLAEELQVSPHSMYRTVIRYLSIQAQLHCLC